MRYRFLGTTGVKVSAVGFGTMSFGGDADEKTSNSLFTQCLDAGVNLFDCANVYSDGRAEEILGRLISHHRDELVITTKAYFPTGKDTNARGGSRYHLVRSVEASLRRLNTDRVDLFFLHRFDEHTELTETLRAVEHLVQSGKVLYPAVSNFAAWQVSKALGIQALHGWSPLTAIQPMYNLVKRQAEVELLPMAQSEQLGVFPYSPLGGGCSAASMEALRGRRRHDCRPTPCTRSATGLNPTSRWPSGFATSRGNSDIIPQPWQLPGRRVIRP